MSRTAARPDRPYLGHKDIDDLLRMNSELLAELWILRDRVTVLEHMLEQKQLISRSELSEFVPSGELASELARERDALVQRVVRAAQSTTADLASLIKQADVG
jgi:hypothetical protein